MNKSDLTFAHLGDNAGVGDLIFLFACGKKQEIPRLHLIKIYLLPQLTLICRHSGKINSDCVVGVKNQSRAIDSCARCSSKSVGSPTVGFGSFDYSKSRIVLGYLLGLTTLGNGNSQEEKKWEEF